jgi:hypothetical protein
MLRRHREQLRRVSRTRPRRILRSRSRARFHSRNRATQRWYIRITIHLSGACDGEWLWAAVSAPMPVLKGIRRATIRHLTSHPGQ